MENMKSSRQLLFYVAPLIFYVIFKEGINFILGVLPKELTLFWRLGIYIICLILFIVLSVSYWKRIRSTTSVPSPIWSNISWFISLFIVSILLKMYVYPLFSQPVNTKITEAVYQNIGNDITSLIFMLMMTIFLTPIAEEILFRGIVMSTYFKDSTYGLDVLVSTFAFAILHLQHPWSWNDFFIYLSGAWILPVVYKKTKSLHYPIIFHILHNGLGPILVTFLKG